jgi:uncharacterized membrane protein
VTVLILGLAIWYAAHLFKRVAPSARERMGDKGKGVLAIVLLISVGLMIWGYRIAEVVPVYAPIAGMGHLNNLLMLISVYFYGVSGTKGILYPRMRHPMLWGTVIWAVAHLLVNGDQASIVLFGGIGIWAVISMVVINRSQEWAPPTNGRGIKGDAMNLVGTLVLFGLIAWIHTWFGLTPFAGTHG